MKKKNEIPAYEKRIAELHSELELVARSLDEKVGQRDSLISTNAKLAMEGSVLEERLAHRSKLLQGLDDLIRDRSVRTTAAEIEYNDRI